ncbi:MAG: hypothetical protein HPY61_01255 [Methanotrichaceae archaeon]|nr:hypothetical protein [Methanotrichaceae archaeon]
MAVVRGHFSGGSDVWTSRDFGWFYYDLDDDTGGETLSVAVNGRLVEKGDLVYSSKPWSEKFEYEPWGTYQAIAFLGKHYLAGYPKSDLTDEVSSLEKGYLREVLIDDDEIHGMSYNSTLPLLGSYSLALSGISNSNEEASLVLLKGGKPVDVAVISEGQSYVFKVEDVPVIMVHVSNIMRGEDSGIVEVNGVFQISDVPEFVLSEGDQLENMEATDVSDQGIELKNNKSLSLRQNSLVSLVDGLMITVADYDRLLYYPIGIFSDYGYHEIRGKVYTADSTIQTSLGQYPISVEAVWDPSSFSGFFFDPEKLIGDENVLLFDTVGRTIPRFMNKVENGTLQADGLQYMSSVQKRDFECDTWGAYRVIGLYGQPWFVGYGPEANPQIDRKDLLEQDYLSRVLMDSGDTYRVVAGNVFRLSEDFDFIISDVGNDTMLVQLLKSNRLVDTSVVRSNTTYIYKEDLADLDDVPLIMLHVQNIFSNTSEKLAIVDGIFQISESTMPVEESLDLGETTIALSDSQRVIIVNPDRINLNRDSTVNLWPGTGLRVADNDTLRYYPLTYEYVIPKPNLPQEISYQRNVTSFTQANFTMVVQAAEISQVLAEILDSSGRTVFSRDLTRLGRGSGDVWLYGWFWNASVMQLSDDASLVLDTEFAPALLYQNSTASPVQVGVQLDSRGRIDSIVSSKVVYYVSPDGYGRLNTTQSYDSMMANQTARNDFIKVVPGESLLRFFEFINDSTVLSETNHTITGSLESLEPHATRAAAPPGRYELRVRIENPANALRVTGAFMNVTAPAKYLPAAEAAEPDKKPADLVDVNSEDQRNAAPAPAFMTALAALAAAFLLLSRRRWP